MRQSGNEAQLNIIKIINRQEVKPRKRYMGVTFYHNKFWGNRTTRKREEQTDRERITVISDKSNTFITQVINLKSKLKQNENPLRIQN